jgi:Beta-propeller repeat
MNAVGICTSLAVSLLLSNWGQAQTGCGLDHTEAGAFICYPNPSENAADASVPQVFHLSAQGNAPEGRTITRYAVEIDGRRIYENRLATPLQRLSIETNLKSPFASGVHTLRVMIDGAGTAEATGIGFHESAGLGFCEPFTRLEARTCLLSSGRGPLEWPAGGLTGGPGPFAGYADLVRLYGQNLQSVEADIADAAAVDAQGSLFEATRLRADIELRRYAANGGLVYDNLVRACGGGFTIVTAVAMDSQGRAWIAGNTTGCIPTTPGAFAAGTGKGSDPHGFVILIDTKKPSSAPPVYATYLSPIANRISALRVDLEGNAYLTGTAGSLEFPHGSVINVGANPRDARLGFVSVLNASGSALRWSTLLRGAQLNGLALDGSGNVYVTGRTASRRSPGVEDDVLVAAVPAGGGRLSYAAHFGGSGAEEGREISTNTAGDWVLVAGETESADFLAKPTKNVANREAPQPFAIALQPCTTGTVYAQIFAAGAIGDSPEIAIAPALDAFAGPFPGSGAAGVDDRNRPSGSIQAASRCHSPIQP